MWSFKMILSDPALIHDVWTSWFDAQRAVLFLSSPGCWGTLDSFPVAGYGCSPFIRKGNSGSRSYSTSESWNPWELSDAQVHVLSPAWHRFLEYSALSFWQGLLWCAGLWMVHGRQRWQDPLGQILLCSPERMLRGDRWSQKSLCWWHGSNRYVFGEPRIIWFLKTYFLASILGQRS